MDSVTRSAPRAELRAAVCFAYFFLIMASYYIMKPIRESLFLDTQGYRQVPKVHILTCLATYLAFEVYQWAARRWRGGRLVSLGQPVLAGGIALFWAALQLYPKAPLLPWIYYLGVALFSSFAVAFFWSLTHTAFTPDESRLHYGWIGAGGIAGGSAGGWLTGQTVGTLGSDNLLLIAAALVLVCWAIAVWLDTHRVDDKDIAPLSCEGGGLYPVLSDRYVLGIGALVFLSLLVSELGDLQSQRVISEAHLDRTQLSAFYGTMYARMNLLGLGISVFLAGPIQKWLGPGPGLLLLPLAASVEAILMARSPDPETLRLILVFALAIQYSIFQSSKELLFNPTPPSVKFQAKTLIDTFGYRLGIAVGALGVLFFLQESPLWTYSLLAILLSVGTAAMAVWLARRYKERLKP